jgi:hypothetical protein
MRTRFLTLFLSLLITALASGQEKVKLAASFDRIVSQELKPFYSASEREIKELLSGEVISQGKVDNPTPSEQQLMLFSSGIHPKSCSRAMRKLSLYENYHQYMDFIKESSYDEKTQIFAFTIDHILLPFPMLVKFKMPRIKQEGYYFFVFENGFLKDLKGTVIVKKIGSHCFLGLKTDWRGAETKLPNIVFGTFLQTVGKLGLEHLIRVSLF